MINDILDFCQISNGKLRLNPQLFDVVESVREVGKLIKFQAKKKGLEFEFINKLNTLKGRKIRNDPNRLKQVILNLLGNALKFTESGFIRIIIEAAEPLVMNHRSQSGTLSLVPAVKISVEDSGCGIKEEDIPRLFRIFGKLETSESRKINQTGVGLGLAISQNLIRYMNNNILGEEIKVSSSIGKGSTFYFSLHSQSSLREAENRSRSRLFSAIHFGEEEDEGKKSVTPPSTKQKRFNSFSSGLNNVGKKESGKIKRVLIVDDDQINIMVLTTYFGTFSDCVYELAFNGKQAVDMVEASAKSLSFFDIIFMDCNMPIMDGFQATQRILQMVKNGVIPAVPIIASTANASQLDYEKCFKYGMVDYMTKPYGKGLLREKIEKYCW